jgi:membrane protein YqaA with SNARE-associated domain
MMLLWAFLIGVVVDSIPVFAPPAWSVLVILIVKYKANPWGVLVFGVAGSTLGRYILSLYIPKLSSKLLNRAENQNLKYVGRKFDQGFWKTSLFVFLYTLTPLSSTTLFTAAAMGRVNPLSILPAFALGKFVSDAVMLFTAKHAAGDITDLFHGKATDKTIIGVVLGLVLVVGLLFVDWHSLIAEKKLKLRFRIWKTGGR